MAISISALAVFEGVTHLDPDVIGIATNHAFLAMDAHAAMFKSWTLAAVLTTEWVKPETASTPM